MRWARDFVSGLSSLTKAVRITRERDAMARYLSEHIDVVGTGRDRIDSVTGRFDFSITDEDRREARRGPRRRKHFSRNARACGSRRNQFDSCLREF